MTEHITHDQSRSAALRVGREMRSVQSAIGEDQNIAKHQIGNLDWPEVSFDVLIRDQMPADIRVSAAGIDRLGQGGEIGKLAFVSPNHGNAGSLTSATAQRNPEVDPEFIEPVKMAVDVPVEIPLDRQAGIGSEHTPIDGLPERAISGQTMHERQGQAVCNLSANEIDRQRVAGGQTGAGFVRVTGESLRKEFIDAALRSGKVASFVNRKRRTFNHEAAGEKLS